MGDISTQGLKIASIFESIINSLATPVFVKNKHHKWILVNDAFCELMGKSREEMLGKTDYDFFDKPEADLFRKKDNEIFTTRDTTVNQETFTDAKGVHHILQTKKMVYQDNQLGDFLCCVISDITELKQYEKELNEANNKLKLILADRTQELKNVNEKL